MSDGYEIPELSRIETAIDGLSSPTSSDVFHATRPFDERAIASVAAQRASGGGQRGMSCILTADSIDAHAITNRQIAWNGIWADMHELTLGNPLAAIPAGLRLDLDPAAPANTYLRPLEDGVWAFVATCYFGPDATFEASFGTQWFGDWSSLVAGAGDSYGRQTATLFLPAWVSDPDAGGPDNRFAFDLITRVAATADPYPVSALTLIITRLA